MCHFVMFDIIHHERKPLLFNIQQTWIKRGYFQEAMIKAGYNHKLK